MRIGIDCRMLGYAGIGRYIQNLAKGIVNSPDKHEYILFGNEVRLTDIVKPGYANIKNVTTFSRTGVSPVNLTPYGVHIKNIMSPVYSIREQFEMPLAARGLSLLHVPHYNVPIFYKERLIVTIHDIIPVLFPQFLSSQMATWYARFMLKMAVQKANLIITGSENTKKDLINHLNVPEEKIQVIYQGVGPEFKKINDTHTLTGCKNRYNLPDKFILFVGNIRPHKNVHNLVRVFLELKATRDIPHKLVLAGKKDLRFPEMRELFNIIEKNKESIIYLGEVAEEDLVYIYNLSDLFVFPSLYEGFGLPPLEAMACGVAVIAMKSSSLPEVIGDGGMLIDPDEPDALMNAIEKVLEDEDLREELCKRGIERSSRFSWDRTAMETLRAYEQ